MKADRRILVPAYLFVCLMLGGSAQMAFFDGLLQLAALAILAWAGWEGLREPLPRDVRRLVLIAGAMLVLVLLHLVPLPAALWRLIPGRAMVTDGLALLGLRPGWQTLSLAPYDTIATALPLLPPLAMLAAVVVLRAYSKPGIVAALLGASLAGLLLGVLQIASPVDNPERFYLQPEVNAGQPSGFFANPNHMASLLLVTVPFTVAWVGSALDRATGKPRHPARLLIGLGSIVALIVGIILNHSLAGLGLLIPVALTSALMVVRITRRARLAFVVMIVLSVASAALVLASPLRGIVFKDEAKASIETRRDYLATSLAAAHDYLPFGSGIGTFQRIYRMKEDPRAIDPSIFVNHAHDDYVELLVETGVPGAILMVIFCLWWVAAVRSMLRAPAADNYAKAGAIASATLLLHSLVDFPLRTTALSACFAMSLALIVASRRSARSSKDLWPTWHVEIS